MLAKIYINFCLRSCRYSQGSCALLHRKLSTEIDTKESGDVQSGDRRLSKAMKSYLERAKAYNEFIKKEEDQFKIGKRHLANMMGLNPETITQEEIDESIEYLFPSGLFEKKARPIMRPPIEIFPPKKDAQFDGTGRPFHYLFYTGKPNFYSVLHELVKSIRTLDRMEDDEHRKGIPMTDKSVELTGSEWINKDVLQLQLVEKLSDHDYNNFITSMERLASHRLSENVKDFIMKYRKSLSTKSMDFFTVIKPLVSEDGRKFVTVMECPRKNARANVTVYSPGTGKIAINGKNIEYFPNSQSRAQILYPLEMTGLLGAVDIEATVSGGGMTGQAGAIRWGISWALRSFVPPDMIETMRLAGLLTRDFRRRERKKPGQWGARRKYTWKKR